LRSRRPPPAYRDIQRRERDWFRQHHVRSETERGEFQLQRREGRHHDRADVGLVPACLLDDEQAFTLAIFSEVQIGQEHRVGKVLEHPSRFNRPNHTIDGESLVAKEFAQREERVWIVFGDQ